jgi:hypothetical protein
LYSIPLFLCSMERWLLFMEVTKIFRFGVLCWTPVVLCSQWSRMALTLSRDQNVFGAANRRRENIRLHSHQGTLITSAKFLYTRETLISFPGQLPFIEALIETAFLCEVKNQINRGNREKRHFGQETEKRAKLDSVSVASGLVVGARCSVLQS